MSALGDLRASVVAALEALPEVAGGDWTVHPVPVDALEPPAFVCQWGPDPWRSIDTACTDTAQLEVLAVAGRLELEGTYPALEAMVDAAITELATARLRPWQALSPAPLEIGNVTYLSGRLQIRRPVTIGGN